MWQQLFLDTIYKPQLAARQLLEMRLEPSETWQALVLASVLNTVMFFFTLLLFPANEGLAFMVVSPVVMAVVLFVVMTVGAASLYYTGRFLAGAAEFNDILTMITWLQYMRLAVQIAGFFLMFLLPGIASMAMFVAGLYGIWILLNFVNEAQGYDSLGKSIGNLFLSFIALTMILSFIFTVLGLGAIE